MPATIGQHGSELAGIEVPGRNDLTHQFSVMMGIVDGDVYAKQLDEKYGRKSVSNPSVLPVAGETVEPMAAPIVAPAPPIPQSFANRMLADAERYLGVPYVYGGTDPQKGLDCSGFVQRVFADMGIKLPRVTYDQVKSGVGVGDRSQLQAGDLLFFNGDKGNRENGHVGIYLGDGRMIAAPYTGAKVSHRKVNWSELTAMRRINP